MAAGAAEGAAAGMAAGFFAGTAAGFLAERLLTGGIGPLLLTALADRIVAHPARPHPPVGVPVSCTRIAVQLEMK